MATETHPLDRILDLLAERIVEHMERRNATRISQCDPGGIHPLIQGGVVSVSVQGEVTTITITVKAGASIGDAGQRSSVSRTPDTMDELTRERSRRALMDLGLLLTHKEAAAYAGRSVQTFDLSLRSHLRDAGTPARPLFFKEDIDQSLNAERAKGGPR